MKAAAKVSLHVSPGIIFLEVLKIGPKQFPDVCMYVKFAITKLKFKNDYLIKKKKSNYNVYIN